jgi:uncharacterized membrane-anchored protein YhcB (DUF1043 family)
MSEDAYNNFKKLLESTNRLQKEVSQLLWDLPKTQRELDASVKKASTQFEQAQRQLESTVSAIPDKSIVRYEHDLSKSGKITIGVVFGIIIATIALTLWLYPKGEQVHINYLQGQIEERDEELQYYREHYPKMVNAWKKKKKNNS